jgi:hypothetical protein
MNYQNGKIYSIRSRSRPDLVYVGSTTQPLSKRFGEHKKPSNILTSQRVIEIGDAYIELIENYPCFGKEELNRREGQIMRTMDCVNRCIAGRTSAEYNQDNKEQITSRNKQYNQDNKEQITSRNKQYRQDNKEQITIWKKQYRQDNKEHIAIQGKQYKQTRKQIETCICGRQYNYGDTANRNRHYKSQTHIAHVNMIYDRLRPRSQAA